MMLEEQRYCAKREREAILEEVGRRMDAIAMKVKGTNYASDQDCGASNALLDLETWLLERGEDE